MARAAIRHCQVVLAAQSSAFPDHLEPEDVVVVDRRDGASGFKRPSAEELAVWREKWICGDIQEKNVVRGGPYG